MLTVIVVVVAAAAAVAAIGSAGASTVHLELNKNNVTYKEGS